MINYAWINNILVLVLVLVLISFSLSISLSLQVTHHLSAYGTKQPDTHQVWWPNHKTNLLPKKSLVVSGKSSLILATVNRCQGFIIVMYLIDLEILW